MNGDSRTGTDGLPYWLTNVLSLTIVAGVILGYGISLAMLAGSVL